MGKVISSTTVTLDGVTTVAEWFVSEGAHDAASRDLLRRSEGMLLGRKTYEGLAGYWPEQEGEWGDMLNPMPKFVVSRTLEGELDWNATVVDGGLDGVTTLTETLDGDLVLIGCGELARNAIEAGLVDELWLWIHPAVWGEGERPFEGARTRLQLLGSESFDSGVVLLRHETAKRAG
jgi:dihydrofolate reductase